MFAGFKKMVAAMVHWFSASSECECAACAFKVKANEMAHMFGVESAEYKSVVGSFKCA